MRLFRLIWEERPWVPPKVVWVGERTIFMEDRRPGLLNWIHRVYLRRRRPVDL